MRANPPYQTIMNNCRGVLSVNNLLFVATDAPSGGLQLLTSTGLGEGPFIRAMFPLQIVEQKYTIFDTSVGSLIIAVHHNDSATNVYMSDSSDAKFALSLANVKVKDNNPSKVEFKLMGVPGIIMANYYTRPNGPLRTVISYDNGGNWHPLPNATNVAGTGVMVHISKKTDNEIWGPLHSRKSAVGLILANGNTGPNVNNTEPSQTTTFFSRTAGMSWTAIASHSTTYEFADHGALMVIADNANPTITFSYSWNEGLDFIQCVMTNLPIAVKAIYSSPNSTSQSFIVHGKREDGTMALLHLDFSELHERVCTQDDYEDWSVMGDKCLLGQVVTYVRRKQSAQCYNPKDFEPEVKSFICGCTPEDYECDYCYESVGGQCVKSKSPSCDDKPPSCDGNNHEYYIPSGYRLVPGTQCDVEKGLNWLPKKIKCNYTGSHKSASGAIVAVVVVFVVVAVIAAGVLVVKNERSRRWVEDRVSWARALFGGRRSTNAWADSFFDNDDIEDAPILNDDAIVHFSEDSSPVK